MPMTILSELSGYLPASGRHRLWALPPGRGDGGRPRSGNGTIVRRSRGGFYGIVADDGERYLPADLPQEFRADGLRVRFVVDP